MKKSLLSIIAVLVCSFLISTSIVGAKALYETKFVLKGERHNLSEIIPNNAKWEKVVSSTSNRFMEGINFDHSGNIWMGQSDDKRTSNSQQ